jgi:hypothetical protein
MLHTAWTWLCAGSPAHGLMILGGLWVVVSFILAKLPKVKSNTTAELVFNFVNPKLLPIIQAIPIVGPLLAAILKTLDTPHPPTAMEQPPLKRASGGFALVSIMCGVGFLGIALAALLAGGCAGVKAPTYNTLTTVVKAVDLARGQLPNACEAAENAAVDAAKSRAESITAAGQIHAKCELALQYIEGVGRLAITARDSARDFSAYAADPMNIMQLAQAVFDLYADLRALLATLHIDLEKIVSGGK